MDTSTFYLNTFLPELPLMLNNNFAAISNYLDLIYNPVTGLLIKPLNTTGSVTANTGSFVNLTVDNLNVRVQQTNVTTKTSTADLAYYNTYIGTNASTSDPSTYQMPSFRYITVAQPYYKIWNDVSIAFETDTKSKIVQVLFEVSTNQYFRVNLDGSTYVRCPSTNSNLNSLELICVGLDNSTSQWHVLRYNGSMTIENI